MNNSMNDELAALMRSLKTVFIDQGCEIVNDDATSSNLDDIISFAGGLAERRGGSFMKTEVDEQTAREITTTVQGVDLCIPQNRVKVPPQDQASVQDLFESFVELNRKVRLAGELDENTSSEIIKWRDKWMQSPPPAEQLGTASTYLNTQRTYLDPLLKSSSRPYRWLPLSPQSQERAQPKKQSTTDFLRSVLPPGTLHGSVASPAVPSYLKLIDDLKAAYAPKLTEFRGTPVQLPSTESRENKWVECSCCGQDLVCLTCVLAKRHDPFRETPSYLMVSNKLAAVVKEMQEREEKALEESCRAAAEVSPSLCFVCGHQRGQQQMAARPKNSPRPPHTPQTPRSPHTPHTPLRGASRFEKGAKPRKKRPATHTASYQLAVAELRERFNALMETRPFHTWYFKKDIQLSQLAAEQDAQIIKLREEFEQREKDILLQMDSSKKETAAVREEMSTSTRKYEAQLVKYERSLAELKVSKTKKYPLSSSSFSL